MIATSLTCPVWNENCRFAPRWSVNQSFYIVMSPILIHFVIIIIIIIITVITTTIITSALVVTLTCYGAL